MFTGGTIWVLPHGHKAFRNAAKVRETRGQLPGNGQVAHLPSSPVLPSPSAKQFGHREKNSQQEPGDVAGAQYSSCVSE